MRTCPGPWRILIGLAVGALIGAWQGFWVAYVGVPAFIVTLAGMLLFRGGNQFIGNADTIPVPQGFKEIGPASCPRSARTTGYNNTTIADSATWSSASWPSGLVGLEFRKRSKARSSATRSPAVGRSPSGSLLLGLVIVFARCKFASGARAPASRSPASSSWR